MDAIQNYSHTQENRIHKRNLWKFFKILRAQANPMGEKGIRCESGTIPVAVSPTLYEFVCRILCH